jgi:hypothetical protein
MAAVVQDAQMAGWLRPRIGYIHGSRALPGAPPQDRAERLHRRSRADAADPMRPVSNSFRALNSTQLSTDGQMEHESTHPGKLEIGWSYRAVYIAMKLYLPDVHRLDQTGHEVHFVFHDGCSPIVKSLDLKLQLS